MQMSNELRQWHSVMQKPIVITEYGADAIAGLHQYPPFTFTEEYQAEVMAKNHAAFDQARREGILHGEMIWNFADFMTKQEITRVLGNNKGVFTRQRQPKMSAHMLRARYCWLARKQWNATMTRTHDQSSTASAMSTCFNN